MVFEADELLVPSSAEEEAKAPPVVAKMANVVAALVAAEGFISPTRLGKAMSVAEAIGKLLGEPSLMRVLVLRALSSPPRPRTAITELKRVAAPLAVAERSALMHAFAPHRGR